MAVNISTLWLTRLKPRNEERYLHEALDSLQGSGFRDTRIPVSSNSLNSFLRLLGSGSCFRFQDSSRDLFPM